MRDLVPEQFLTECKSTPVVDVRSPDEFARGHIPEAVNLPLFNNAERAVIGTIYTKTGRQEAIGKGLDIVGPKMSEFIRIVKELSPSGNLLVYCWRGGMRSESMAWLFEKAGMNCATLRGGYKAYRNYLLNKTGNIPELILLDGFTGSGKTEILQCLKKKGEQVIDLEHHAGHSGSVFGGINKHVQPTTQQFQNSLFGEIFLLDKSKRVWMEAESKSIGKVFLPSGLWERMTVATVIEVIVPAEERVKRLTAEYGCYPAGAMEEAISSLHRRLGEKVKNEILMLYREKKLQTVASRLLDYYDKIYLRNLERTGKRRIAIDLPGGDANLNADLILENLIQQELKTYGLKPEKLILK